MTEMFDGQPPKTTNQAPRCAADSVFRLSQFTNYEALTVPPAEIFKYDRGFLFLIAEMCKQKIRTLAHLDQIPAFPFLQALAPQLHPKFWQILYIYGIRADNPEQPTGGPYIARSYLAAKI